MDFTIKVENIGKKYIISHKQKEKYLALRDVIANSFKNIAKKIAGKKEPNPTKEEFWALNDINFTIKEGERVGIIGRNGAGKSTLLKILSRITEPSTGKFSIKGRVASLLEVGTGFHPELTGRENIFLNGAILGMTRQEIKKKFDEIVAFSEVEKFLDTPVKRYSSGMYVRLAFAVAAHLEPEILIVDEVLAVGDAQFQKKCLGKMNDIGKDGRTVLFVSHNMGAIKQLCNTAIFLKDGKILYEGLVDKAIKEYMTFSYSNNKINNCNFSGTLANSIIFEEIYINEKKDQINLSPSDEILVKIKGKAIEDILNFRVTLSIYKDEIRVVTMHDVENPVTLLEGYFESLFKIPNFFLRPGDYSVSIGGYREGASDWTFGRDILSFTVAEEWSKKNDFANVGVVNLPYFGERICLEKNEKYN
ncbi:MAG: hypothetical protein A2086_00945 [Spirochaetes bacterium GWD1_27_9]|nr:MAG: hypothetical protein A2Z98_03850 [Spirochaetes bacterium GWB1_27_13]OHD24214.1 MAG: hypothetical protein A2Y34_02535 [Spirochaetes bacterium GWC1_27_15]OHD33619.1 MAG: hypothetical protein A2086_00945 [Spirochaetes bacterium GWD1_27_9]